MSINTSVILSCGPRRALDQRENAHYPKSSRSIFCKHSSLKSLEVHEHLVSLCEQEGISSIFRGHVI
jgi:hypothetical protein